MNWGLAKERDTEREMRRGRRKKERKKERKEERKKEGGESFLSGLWLVFISLGLNATVAAGMSDQQLYNKWK